MEGSQEEGRGRGVRRRGSEGVGKALVDVSPQTHF